jgi:hypothetical protein
VRFLPLLFLAGCTQVIYEHDIRLLRERREQMQRDLPPELPLWMPEFEKAIADHDEHIPYDIYLHVVRKLYETPDTEVEKLVETKVAAADLEDDPPAHRGRFFRLVGRVISAWVEDVRSPRCPVERLYGVMILVQDREPVLAHVLTPPVMLDLKNDMIGIDGLFFKVIEYELKSGGRLSAPFLVARRVEKYD